MKKKIIIAILAVVLTLATLCCIIKFAAEAGAADQATGPGSGSKEDPPIIRLLSSSSDRSYDDAIQASLRYPYIAAIVAESSSQNTSSWGFICFGSVIRMKWLVTAAHCKKPVQFHRVLLFYDYIHNNTKSHLIVQWVVHAGFNPNISSPWHDIALARTNEDLQRNVDKPGLLHVKQVHAGIWKTLMNMEHRMYLTNDFDIYAADVVDPQRCYEFYGISLDYTLFCVDMSRYSYCFITEFGPVFTAAQRVLGILKVKPNNCDLKVAVFTNVSTYTDWILEVTEVDNSRPL